MRFYERTKENPDGVKENEAHCVAEVCKKSVPCQCSRNRGHGNKGLFCPQHSSGRPTVPFDWPVQID